MSDEKTEIEQLRAQVETLQAESQKQQTLAALAQLRERGDDQSGGLWASMSQDAKILTACLAVIWFFVFIIVIAGALTDDLDFTDTLIFTVVGGLGFSVLAWSFNPIGQRAVEDSERKMREQEQAELEAEREQLEWEAAHPEVFEAQRLKAEAENAEAVAAYNQAQAAAAYEQAQSAAESEESSSGGGFWKGAAAGAAATYVATKDNEPEKTNKIMCGYCNHIMFARSLSGVPDDRASHVYSQCAGCGKRSSKCYWVA